MAKKKLSIDKGLFAKALMAVGAAVLLGIAGWLVYSQVRESSIEKWEADERGNLVAAVDDASQAAAAGDSERAQEIYNQAIANSESDNEELMLTIARAYSLLNDGDLDGALSLASEAESRWKRVDTATLLGDVYAAQDKKDDAKRNYELAIERLDPGEYDHDSAKKMLQSKIKSL